MRMFRLLHVGSFLSSMCLSGVLLVCAGGCGDDPAARNAETPPVQPQSQQDAMRAAILKNQQKAATPEKAAAPAK